MLTDDKLESIVTGTIRLRTKPVDKLVVRSLEDGIRIWEDKDVKSFYYDKSMKWQPKNRTAVFLPCSAWKPYPYSPSHKDGYLKALLPYLRRVDLFVVSEPMTIVPYCYSDEYPIDSYEYDPTKFFMGSLREPLASHALDVFVSRLADWVGKFNARYETRILILPRSWHLRIFHRALERAGISKEHYSTVRLPGRARNNVESLRKSLKLLLEE